MHCPKAGSIVFLGLVLMTAGFVLTLAGWFAPPIREAVLRVRLAGPVSLLVGFLLLGVSCCLCAFQQRKCCSCCYPPGGGGGCGEEEEGHTQLSPLLLREMRQAMDRCGGEAPGGATTTSSSAASLPVYDPHHSVPPPPEQWRHLPPPPPHHYYNRHTGGGRPKRAGRKKRRPKGPKDATPNACDVTLHPYPPRDHVTPRPAAIFVPRAGLYQETYFCRDAADLHKVKVTVQPLPVATSSPSGSPTAQASPPAAQQAGTPTVFFRNYAEEIVSAL